MPLGRGAHIEQLDLIIESQSVITRPIRPSGRELLVDEHESDDIQVHSCQFCSSLRPVFGEPYQEARQSRYYGLLHPFPAAVPVFAWLSCVFLTSCLLPLFDKHQSKADTLMNLIVDLTTGKTETSVIEQNRRSAGSLISRLLQQQSFRNLQLEIDVIWPHSNGLRKPSMHVRWRAPDTGRYANLSSAQYWVIGDISEIDVPHPRPDGFNIKNRLNPDPQSEHSFSRIQVWLEDCKRNHERCQALERQRQSLAMPSRLICIRGNGNGSPNLSLQEVSGPTPYIALSYCWGQDQSSFFTTLKNVEARLSSLVYDELSRTIRDAVRVCLALGCSFLWVDALCIIQDDDADKQVELAKMADVYTRADLVISSARAAKSSDGFLGLRPATVVFDMTPILSNITQYFDDVARLPHPIAMIDWRGRLETKMPITKRAWTVQEHRKAQRLLQYRTGSTLWHCMEQTIVDGSSILDRDMGSLRPLEEEFSIPDHIKPWAQHPDDPLEGWYELVKVFMDRSITVQSDRLPAIAAFARDIVMTRGFQECDYKAGIWHSPSYVNLSQILWTRAAHSFSPHEDAGIYNLVRAGPTWAWSSSISSINSFGSGKNISWLIDPYTVKIEVELKDPAFPFGEVVRGTLTLQGYVRTLTRSDEDTKCRGWNTQQDASCECPWVINKQDPKFRTLRINWDALTHPVVNNVSVLAVQDKNLDQDGYGLVLVPRSLGGYIRIGTYRFM